jgi:hypothetical protein
VQTINHKCWLKSQPVSCYMLLCHLRVNVLCNQKRERLCFIVHVFISGYFPSVLQRELQTLLGIGVSKGVFFLAHSSSFDHF